MKYTKQEIDSMQDSEINACLAAKYFPESAYVEGDKVFYSEKHDGDNVTSISTVFDFNNWQCIMPLASDRGVTIKCSACPAGSGFSHYAESYCGLYFTDYMEPKKAAASILLMV